LKSTYSPGAKAEVSLLLPARAVPLGCNIAGFSSLGTSPDQNVAAGVNEGQGGVSCLRLYPPGPQYRRLTPGRGSSSVRHQPECSCPEAGDLEHPPRLAEDLADALFNLSPLLSPLATPRHHLPRSQLILLLLHVRQSSPGLSQKVNMGQKTISFSA